MNIVAATMEIFFFFLDGNARDRTFLDRRASIDEIYLLQKIQMGGFKNHFFIQFDRLLTHRLPVDVPGEIGQWVGRVRRAVQLDEVAQVVAGLLPRDGGTLPWNSCNCQKSRREKLTDWTMCENKYTVIFFAYRRLPPWSLSGWS